jgi:hypothetical protein
MVRIEPHGFPYSIDALLYMSSKGKQSAAAYDNVGIIGIERDCTLIVALGAPHIAAIPLNDGQEPVTARIVVVEFDCRCGQCECLI